MKQIILSIILSIPLCVLAQDGSLWHNANDTLKGPWKGGYRVSTKFFNRYDTIHCDYIGHNIGGIQHGYKRAYIEDGFYVDDKTTVGIFFDANMCRIDNVLLYCFLSAN